MVYCKDIAHSYLFTLHNRKMTCVWGLTLRRGTRPFEWHLATKAFVLADWIMIAIHTDWTWLTYVNARINGYLLFVRVIIKMHQVTAQEFAVKLCPLCCLSILSEVHIICCVYQIIFIFFFLMLFSGFIYFLAFVRPAVLSCSLVSKCC